MAAASPTKDMAETDRAFHRLVGLVLVAALAALGMSLYTTVQTGIRHDVIWPAIALATLTAVCIRTYVTVRVRSSRLGVSWIDVATLISVAILPAELVVPVVFVGSLAMRSLMRLRLSRIAFGLGKDTLLAAVAVLTFALSGGAPLLVAQATPAPLAQLAPIGLAFLLATLADEVISVPAVSLATNTRMKDRFLTDIDLRWGSNVVRFVVAVAVLVLIDVETQLLMGVPPLVFSLHLMHQARVRAREERRAWENLAASTDALNAVQLGEVLQTAVTHGSRLFSADDVEVETWLDGPRQLVRGNTEGVSHLGDPDNRAYDPAMTAVIPLISDSDGVRIGELRLCFRAPIGLSEREHFTLRTFAGSLCTAIRNASSFATLEQLARKHEHDAAHDPLTGLPNRRRLQEEIDTALEQHPGAGGLTALLLMDLNHFKDINDALGHSAGDQVLVTVAQRLSEAAGPDALVARWGGDEFAVLYPVVPAPALALHRATLLMETLREPVMVNNMPLPISASAGVATAPDQGGLVELMRRADIAMYQAKRTRRQVAAYAEEDDPADKARLVVGGMLPQAVAEREFTLEFQPIVDLATAVPIAAEALARWQHPEKGRIGPGSFVNQIGQSGLLMGFTDAVLEQALAAAAQWRAAGCDYPVAVNFESRSLLDRRLPRLVERRLADHNLPGDALIIELTEGGQLSKLEVVDDVLAELRDLGCSLALDDFGTGFSSISDLPRTAVQEIKIDITFVSKMEQSSKDLAIVRSIIDMAKNLEILVVAEGVERESQRRLLWELGCPAGQGHLFARSMPLNEMMKLATPDGPTPLAEPIHEPGSVVRMPTQRRTRNGSSRKETTSGETSNDGRASSS